MIRWTKDGKVDRSTRLVIGAAGPEIEHCANWHDLADALDAAVAALRNIVEAWEWRSELFTDDANCAGVLLDKAMLALRQIGVEQ